MTNPLNLAWFTATPFGSPFSGLTEDTYDFLFGLAECELERVACNCPKVYPYALAIKISIMVPAMGINAEGQADPSDVNVSDYVAYVKSDKVYDVEREYMMKKVQDQLANSSPAGILQSIIDKCEAKAVRIGAFLVGSFPGLDACGCSDWTLQSRFGDKTDSPVH